LCGSRDRSWSRSAFQIHLSSEVLYTDILYRGGSMPRISIRRCAEVFSVQRCFQAVRLINRHAPLLGPLLAATFAIVAGWIASDYGAQYLFRDNERLDYFGLCDPGYPCIWKSARLHSALYATALMGLVWTLLQLKAGIRTQKNAILSRRSMLSCLA
jgi:hypothetical protein